MHSLRWSSEDRLIITLSAHNTEHSLLHMVGLARPLRTVTRNGAKLLLVDSLEEALRDKAYLQQCSTHCTVILHPGTAIDGHFLELHF